MLIGHRLVLAVQRYDKIYSALKPPLTLHQLFVLAAMEQGKTSSESKVSSKTGIPQDNVREILHRLLRRRFISRAGNHVAVAKKTSLTPAGIDAVERSLVLAKRAEAELFKAMPESAKLAFSACLWEVTRESVSPCQNL